MKTKPRYEVFHPDAEGSAPTFKTWDEARNAAKLWNRECPGHVARKRSACAAVIDAAMSATPTTQGD